ncbi:MAG: hypothetical protein P4L43_05210 [Syntrophobacteraceae bacterium]|nr:hypothetical protein [Syntrophobacteraceae bacterium]
MTSLLKKAFDAASLLPVERRDAIAELVLSEIEDDTRWDEAFANSQDILADMATKAIAAHKAWQTKSMEEILRSARRPVAFGKLLNVYHPM